MKINLGNEQCGEHHTGEYTNRIVHETRQPTNDMSSCSKTKNLNRRKEIQRLKKITTQAAMTVQSDHKENSPAKKKGVSYQPKGQQNQPTTMGFVLPATRTSNDTRKARPYKTTWRLNKSSDEKSTEVSGRYEKSMVTLRSSNCRRAIRARCP